VTTLTEFLEARLAEDEATARATLIDVKGSGYWHADERPVALTVDLYRVRDDNARPVVEAVKSLYGDEGPAEPLYVDGEAVAAHVARHDPARVLREVAAKRDLLDRHASSERSAEGPLANDSEVYYAEALEEAVRILATTYSDHQDFREEWAA
jgi:hypothetical protein